ncbi:uncharacterized protein TNCT_449431 [Trichonephila clavata]|uniref:Transposase Helix-turn-helix domain-containing protein n=1 Tax=Trichonephila clavata TaxID=2740835 RepID=A0A8X6LKD7_TRICU|nr:uncharacterized protein TNCT_449431 [Trichonephila clavata]
MLSEKDNALKEVNSRLEKEKFIPENIRDDTKMKALTNFTIKEFFCIYRFLQIEDDLSVDTKRRSIDRYFMFLVKLRTGISNEFLSVLFGISDSTVSRDFNLVTDVLHDKLKLQDVFPTKDEKPASPMEQQMTFSRYKNANTLKGMIGITPNGAISFISELYSGSISDKGHFIRWID